MLFSYLSSGFIPVETLPKFLRIFVENQPMTPLVVSIRSLLLFDSLGNNILKSIFWCVALLLLSYFIAVKI